MSDPLDRLFRDAQIKVPHATPPQGQWDRIRRRESVLPTTKDLPLMGVLVLGLLLGLCGGLALGGYFFGASCPETTDSITVAGMQTGRVAKESLPVGVDVAPSTTSAPATALKKQVYPKHESQSFSGSSLKKAPNLIPAKDGAVVFKSVSKTMTVSSGVERDSTE